MWLQGVFLSTHPKVERRQVFLPLTLPPKLKQDLYFLLKEMCTASGTWAESEITLLEQQCDSIKAKISTGLDKFLENKIPEDVWLQKQSEWQQELAVIERKIQEYQSGNLKDLYDPAKATLEKVADIHQLYLSSSDGFKRASLLQQVVLNLKVTKEKLYPVYRKPYIHSRISTQGELGVPRGIRTPVLALKGP